MSKQKNVKSPCSRRLILWGWRSKAFCYKENIGHKNKVIGKQFKHHFAVINILHFCDRLCGRYNTVLFLTLILESAPLKFVSQNSESKIIPLEKTKTAIRKTKQHSFLLVSSTGDHWAPSLLVIINIIMQIKLWCAFILF